MIVSPTTGRLTTAGWQPVLTDNQYCWSAKPLPARHKNISFSNTTGHLLLERKSCFFSQYAPTCNLFFFLAWRKQKSSLYHILSTNLAAIQCGFKQMFWKKIWHIQMRWNPATQSWIITDIKYEGLNSSQIHILWNIWH